VTGQNECVTGCGRPTRDQRLLCDHHVWELEQALAEIPALLDELAVTLTRQDKLGHGEGGNKPTKASEQPLPYGVQASEKLGELRAFLVGWIRDVAETHGHELPADDLRAMSRWLLARLDLLAAHPAADDVYGEITSAVAHGWRACDRAATRTRFIVGPCPELDGVAACIGDVWAHIPTSEDKQAVMVCAHCGATWETHQWLRAGKRILDVVKRAERKAATHWAIFGEAPA
jgi:hypothetical protein